MEPEDTLLIPSILTSSQRPGDEHSEWPGYHADDIMSYRFDAGQSCAAVQEQLRHRGMATTEMLCEKETQELLTAYAKLPEAVRRKLRTFAKGLGEDLA